MDELILRSLRGETSPLEEAELRSWRSAASENERHYREVVAISRVAPRLDATRPTEVAPPASDLIEQADQRVLGARHSMRLRTRRQAWRRATLAAAAVAVVALAVSLYVARDSHTGGQPQEIVAGPSETTTVTLQDGSVVRLAPRSRLWVDPRRAREVSLEGRGFFAVARSPDRPFRVHTRAGEAVVLGTRFELSTENDGLRLLVVEGHVALDAGGSRVDVRDSQMSRVVQGTISEPQVIENAAEELHWLGEFLVFQATPLPQVARELERVYGVRVVITDSMLQRQAVTGWYSDRAFDEVFEIICRVLDARCSIDDGVATVGRRANRR